MTTEDGQNGTIEHLASGSTEASSSSSEGKIEHLSHSTMETLSQCGHKLWLTKVKRVARTPGWSLIGGSAFHLVRETLDWRDFGRELEQADNFIDAFNVLVEEQEAKDGCPPQADWYQAGRKEAKEDKAWWLENGPVMVERYKVWRSNAPMDIWIMPDGNPAIEVEIKTEIDNVPFVGYVDRIEQMRDGGRLLLVDDKTGSRVPSSHQQLGKYGLALGQVLGLTFDHGAYWMSRKGSLTAPEPLYGFYDGRLQWEMSEAWGALQRGSYGPAKDNMFCGSCGVRESCYLKADGPVPVDLLPWGAA